MSATPLSVRAHSSNGGAGLQQLSLSSPLSSPTWNAESARAQAGSMQAGAFSPSSLRSPLGSPPSAAATPSASASAASSLSASAPAGASSPSAASSSNRILAAVRLRPLSARELDRGEANVWRTSSQSGVIEEIGDAIGKRYGFDYVCPPAESTTELYKSMVRKTVLKACIGYNSNVLSYGQTASGKTFTSLGNESSPGIVLLAIGDVFHYISQSPNRQFLLRCSMLEIYCEEINDLLNPGPEGQNLKLETVGGVGKDGLLDANIPSSVKVRGLTQEFVKSPAEFIALLLRGEENRKIASTDANLRSSRSHTVFRIHIESRARATPAAAAGGVPAAPVSKKIRSSLLTFVDLAGSECILQLGGSAERERECRAINRSLLGLSRVIRFLSENSAAAAENGPNAGNAHVPFRDSKLTRLLQPALGGNSHTLFICCISPVSGCRDESHNTLRFGSFAKHVTNAARVNLKEEKTPRIDKYAAELDRLKSEMERRRLAEESELDILRAANESLKSMLRDKESSLSSSEASILASTQALQLERMEREAAEAKAAEERTRLLAAGQSPPKSDDEQREAELLQLRLALKIAQAQVDMLEGRLVHPEVEQGDSRRADAERLRLLGEKLDNAKAAHSALEAERDREREQGEAERRRVEAEKDSILRSLLAEKLREQQRLEGRIARETEALQRARIVALYAGTVATKCSRRKAQAHPVALSLGPQGDPSFLRWVRPGVAGSFQSERKLQLREVERMKIGQSTAAFDRLEAGSEWRSSDAQSRSFSLITPSRSLDLILPSAHHAELWIEGLKPFLPPGVKIDDGRPGAEQRRREAEEERHHEEAKSNMQAAAEAAAKAASLTPVKSGRKGSNTGPAVGASSPYGAFAALNAARKEEAKEHSASDRFQ